MSSSSSVQPRLQMSEPVVKRDIWMISGAIQYGVPTTAPTPVVSPSLRATPRSASLTWVSVKARVSVKVRVRVRVTVKVTVTARGRRA